MRREERRVRLALRADDYFVEIPLPGAPEMATGRRLRAVISLRRAGHMGRDDRPSTENRIAFFKELGLDGDRVFSVKQIHSRTVLEIAGGRPGDYRAREADGLITAGPFEVLGVTAADCLPIFLYHPSGRAWAAVHSGWQGTGIIGGALEIMETRLGAVREEVGVVLGPGIGECCYSVSNDRYDGFTAVFGPRSGLRRGQKYYLNLRQANLNILSDLGVTNVTVVEDCTCCQPLFGSFRREGRDNFNNMLALIGYF